MERVVRSAAGPIRPSARWRSAVPATPAVSWPATWPHRDATTPTWTGSFAALAGPARMNGYQVTGRQGRIAKAISTRRQFAPAGGSGSRLAVLAGVGTPSSADHDVCLLGHTSARCLVSGTGAHAARTVFRVSGNHAEYTWRTGARGPRFMKSRAGHGGLRFVLDSGLSRTRRVTSSGDGELGLLSAENVVTLVKSTRCDGTPDGDVVRMRD